MAATLVGCGLWDPPPSLEQDRAEQAEVLSGLFVTYWKGAKISIRSVPLTPPGTAIDFDEVRERQAEQLRLGKHLSRIYDWESFLRGEEADVEPLGAKELVELAQEIYVLAGVIDEIDEDGLPTFLEVVSSTRAALLQDPLAVPPYWNSSMDHWTFALVMEARAGLGSWRTYELYKVDPGQMRTVDLAVLSGLHKGIDSLRSSWFFLAEEQLSQTLSVLEADEITLVPEVRRVLLAAAPGSEPGERFRLLSRATTYCLLGFARRQIEDPELRAAAAEDVSAALADFSALGIQNELVTAAQAYVAIEAGDYRAATRALARLEESPLLSSKEKEISIRTRAYLEQRDPDSALVALTDKLMLYRLGMSYAYSYAIEIQWLQLLEKTERGRRILDRFTELEQIYRKAEGYLDVDRLKERGEELWRELRE